MQKTRSSDKNKRFEINSMLSIWLATLTVVFLIVLFALVINSAREKDMVEQYSKQQLTIARGTAAGIEDLVVGVERSMINLSRLPCVKGTMPEATLQSLKVIYSDLEGKVSFIAIEDKDGVAIGAYPASFLKEMTGESFQFYRYFQEVKKTGRPYISDLVLAGGEKGKDLESKFKSIIIAVPRYDSDNEFSGVVFAALSLSTIIDRYIRPVKCEVSCYSWMVDDGGTILVHHDAEFIGKNIGILEGAKSQGSIPLKDILLKDEGGYGEYLLLADGGRVEKNVVAYAPIHLGSRKRVIAINSPYDMVISLLRKTFLDIMSVAVGLIVVVIIGSMFMVHSGRKRLRLEEEVKHLKERSVWQEKLAREKKTIEGIIEGSPIPTFVINKEHEIILWSKACTELTGFDSKEMIGTDRQHVPFYPDKRPVIADLIIDNDTEGLKKYYGGKMVQESVVVKGAYEASDFFKDLGGKDRHLYFLAAPIYDKKGEVIAAIETLQDVSHEKEMGLKLKEYAETLENELDKNVRLKDEMEGLYNYLQSILDSSPDLVFVFNSEGAIDYVSREMREKNGSAFQQIKGKHFTGFVAPEHRDSMLEKWKEIKRGIFKPFEIEVKREDGSARNLLLISGPIKGTDRYVVVQRDITEFKNLEKKFYESQKLAAVGQLSAGIAHEVRNPLSSIKMSLQILEKRLKPSGNDLKRFKIAEKEVEHLEKLVRDILIFAKPGEPKKELDDINKFLGRSLAMAEKEISDKKINIQYMYDKNIPLVKFDSAMLEEAFLNIYLNAVDAMEDRGKLLISTKLLKNKHDSIVVKIEDNGCGIDEEDLHHIFNPFFTKKKYGTGLGLTQVKKIVDLHQGTVEVVSKKGKGTTVCITFPIFSEET
ncbi:MAG: PAS domain S-box protein [Thermodesulfobacteriota bacterium]|nr:PAS domain S-box protein [Thermodesulfobacteriota bacterium]